VPVQRLPGVLTGPRSAEGEQEEARRGLLTTTMGKAVAWARKNSMWPATFGLACCAIEMCPGGGWRSSGHPRGRRT
jgi:NADH:ubiquinone oxidoreductase subunit B-like Fe-S oxidoreductase